MIIILLGLSFLVDILNESSTRAVIDPLNFPLTYRDPLDLGKLKTRNNAWRIADFCTVFFQALFMRVSRMHGSPDFLVMILDDTSFLQVSWIACGYYHSALVTESGHF